MAEAKRDENRVTTLLGVDSADGLTPLKAEITETTGRLRVDTLITGDDATTTDVDDDNIAKAQVLPLNITEPYVFSKTDDAWIRTQGTSDGYQITRTSGVFDSAGNEMNISAAGDLSTHITDGTSSASVTLIDDSTDDLDGQIGLVTNSVMYGRVNDDTVSPIGVDGSTQAIEVIQYDHHEIHSGSHYYLEGHATLGNGGILRVKLVTPDSDKWAHFVWDISSNSNLTTDFYEGASGGMANGSRAVIHANNRNINCWTGTHTGADDQATVLTDSTQAWTIDALIGMQVFNETDGSSAFITDNTATTVTVNALAGGTGNDWDTDDKYEINNSQMVVEKAVDVADDVGLLVSDAGWSGRTAGGTSRDDEIVLKRNTIYYRVFTSTAADNTVSFKASWYEHTDKN